MGDIFYTLYGLKNKISRCFFFTKRFGGLSVLGWWWGGGGMLFRFGYVPHACFTIKLYLSIFFFTKFIKVAGGESKFFRGRVIPN